MTVIERAVVGRGRTIQGSTTTRSPGRGDLVRERIAVDRDEDRGARRGRARISAGTFSLEAGHRIGRARARARPSVAPFRGSIGNADVFWGDRRRSGVARLDPDQRVAVATTSSKTRMATATDWAC